MYLFMEYTANKQTNPPPSATCYKTVRAYAECRDALSKAANCYQQNRSLFAAAKCYEQGVLMSKELSDLATVVTLCERAAKLYQVGVFV